MRFKSNTVDGYTIYAVTGVNTVSFAIDFDPAHVKGLLGFAVEREDPTENEKYFMRGFKVFESVVPNPKEDIEVSTFEHPVQSFVWDDFTAKDNRKYVYTFHPVKGTAKKLDRSEKTISIEIETEKLIDTQATHQIFFNRGVMSSQAYARKFKNKSPDKIKPKEKSQEAFDWLARDLLNGFKAFIKQAKPGHKLYGCFYEFHYKEAVQLFKDALDKGVDVNIIIDAKIKTDKKTGKDVSFPRNANLETLGVNGVNFPMNRVILRQKSPSAIQHNKFLIWVDGNDVPQAVWTGSTNISDGGIFGHTNVGHWVNNAAIAGKYMQYWDLLKKDEQGKEFEKNVEKIQADIEATDILNTLPNGIVPIFSPRPKVKMLEVYSDLLDTVTNVGCITLAFGVNKLFKDKLLNNPAVGPITFLLLEKEDKPTEKNKDTFVSLNSRQNVYQSFGSFLNDALNRWSRETNQKLTQLNNHVTYVHSKFLLADPLGKAPIVVTGSANFSDKSTTTNDENMIIIKGDKRVADIYFTEFNRLFNHYYFRSIFNKPLAQNKADKTKSLFLAENDSWLENYKPGTLRSKRVKMYKDMNIY